MVVGVKAKWGRENQSLVGRTTSSVMDSDGGQGQGELMEPKNHLHGVP
jgi:hypothetical protein